MTAGSPVVFNCTLKAPTNQTVLVSGASLTAAATLANGTPPYTVEYFTNSGAGNGAFASAGTSATAPYNVSLGGLSAGTYRMYAVATDSATNPASTKSMTNAFFVADPILVVLTAPIEDATFDNAAPVTAAATLAGGTPP